jgi:hypothetical protein
VTDEYQKMSSHEIFLAGNQPAPRDEEPEAKPKASAKKTIDGKLKDPILRDSVVKEGIRVASGKQPKERRRSSADTANEYEPPHQVTEKSSPQMVSKPSGSPDEIPLDVKESKDPESLEKKGLKKQFSVANNIRQSRLSQSIVNAPAARGKPLPNIPDLHNMSLPALQGKEQADDEEDAEEELKDSRQQKTIIGNRILSTFGVDEYERQFPLRRAGSTSYLIRFNFFYQALYFNLFCFLFYQIPALRNVGYGVLAFIPMVFGACYTLSGVVQTLCLLMYTGTLAETDLVEFYRSHQK